MADPEALQSLAGADGKQHRFRWSWEVPVRRPLIRILKSAERVPWSGHSSRYAIAEVYEEITRAKMTLVFVNTRSQAEMTVSMAVGGQ